MNRLVIIGNGFDLAHGLPTSYNHFIDWYWRGVCEGLREQDKFDSKYEDRLISTTIKFTNQYNTKAVDAFKSLSGYDSLINLFNNLKENASGGFSFYHSFNYKNSFFKSICDKNYIQNWVDIENEYYQLLKECLKERDNTKVKKLNEEFEQVKNLLEEYLTTEVEGKFDLVINRDVYSLITKNKYEFEEIDALFKEVSSSEIKNIRKDVTEYSFGEGISRSTFSVKYTNFLNFNYTPLIKKFFSNSDQKIFRYNQIHGVLNNEENPIVFGFGDEMDDDYKTIEKKDDNEYLKNIKSFAYLNTPNYKNLIDFLESDKFQVYIMGHSCGISDRILLNKVFEHKNCISIKIFFHKYDKPKEDGRTDDYTNIAQNVSRHFNKKEMMRERIVNKTYCEPLPQTKIPLKKEFQEKK